jgi:Tol biopolymer transport system component
LPTAPGAKPRPLLRTPATDVAARISPDGRFIAYRSDESRPDDIYVRPFDPSANPEPGTTSPKWRISTAGSNGAARWRDDGKELYFLAVSGDFMVVDVNTASASFEVGPPRVLFTTPQAFRTSGNPGQFADVSSDGKVFVLMMPLQP